MEQPQVFGWFSLEDFKQRNVAYIYHNIHNIKVVCSFTSESDICPFYQRIDSFPEDVIFIGELKKYIDTITYGNDNFDTLILPIISNDNKNVRRLKLSYNDK